jgi:ubiquinone/menaquinone biosynthesis C-methylase UbiE
VKDPNEIKDHFSKTFSRVAPVYDRDEPRWFSLFGRELIERLKIKEGGVILDIGTGRGACLIPALEKSGDSGKVTGIDIAEEMLKETADDLLKRNLTNYKLLHMDAENLAFGDNTFDYVSCGFSLFFYPDHSKALGEIMRVLKPGGYAGFTTFGAQEEYPYMWFWEMLRQVIGEEPVRNKRDDHSHSDDSEKTDEPPVQFDTFDALRSVMESAGIMNATFERKEYDIVYSDEESWFNEYYRTGCAPTMDKIPSDKLSGFKTAVFKKLQEHREPDGFHSTTAVIYTIFRNES